MQRSTKAETEHRVEQVYKLLLGGATFPDLREFAHAPEQNWDVSDGQIRRYMTAAHRLIRERYEARADHSFAQHMLRREALFAHAMGAGDFNCALRILQDEAKLEDLYPAEKRELAGKGGTPIVLLIQEEIAVRQPRPALPTVVEEVVASPQMERLQGI